MGKSASGVGMLDCIAYIHKMDQQLSSRTTMLVIPDGSCITPSCTISLLTVFHSEDLHDKLTVATTSAPFPSHRMEKFSAELFRAIVEHDSHISSTYFDVLGGAKAHLPVEPV